MSVDLLCIVAHPDDAEIGCGGLILKELGAGRSVAVVDATRGEAGSFGDPETRAAECRAATEVMGLEIRENLGLPDAGLIDGAELRAALVGAIRRHCPDTLLVPHPEDPHPDHAALGLAGRAAAFLAGLANAGFEGEHHRPRLVIHKLGMTPLRPDFVVPVDDVWATKRSACECYVSQVVDHRGSGRLPGGRTILDRMEERDRAFGLAVGVEYAEAYTVHGLLPLDGLTWAVQT